jgi:hypothetical protein
MRGDPRLPAGLHQSFRQAVAELGMASAAWLFVEEVEAAGGQELLRALRDELGRTFAVLDAVVADRLEGAEGPRIDVDRVLSACEGAEDILVVGLETRFLDALVDAVAPAGRLASTRPAPRIQLLTQSVFQPDWTRVAANYIDRVELVGLDRYQRAAGPRSVMLTCVYGSNDKATYVLPAWVRASGEDVRTQFRALLGWEALGRTFYVYPRWLVEVPLSGFTDLVLQ